MNEHYNVTVLDMQPIDPPTGGGRIRLLGLYHNLGDNLSTTYVGTYDWEGEKYRDHYLSQTLREINVPLSNAHFDEVKKLQDRIAGKTIIDVTFPQFAHLSQDYIKAATEWSLKSDIVIFSHPWIYPLIKDKLDKDKQLIVYDSQNVEGYLRYNLLGGGETETNIVKDVIKVEYELCHFADVVLTCSHEDRELFNRLYNVPFKKMKVIPNGVFTDKIKPVESAQKKTIKQKLGLPQKMTAIFVASNYPPNVEAANYILTVLSPNLPDVSFLIAGGVGEALKSNQQNVIITGRLTEEEKIKYLSAADMAINPMFSGSGTNIKMFDFMAAGLPIVSTPAGARGIEDTTFYSIKLCNSDKFAANISLILNDAKLIKLMSQASRQLVEEKYSFERISKALGTMLYRYRSKPITPKPFFSIIVPSYNRHNLLDKLMNALSLQDYKDFEVIVVDQSDTVGVNKYHALDLLYIHTDTKGAVKARNTASLYARGRFLAFTDDDCIPEKNWLKEAYRIFNSNDIIGIEGLVKSDKLNDPVYRPVTNEGFGGIGFMTANLFLKTEIFNRINGFDERFDNPHFREDTDLGWRAVKYGKIPFSDKVQVFHPPHLRAIERESQKERNKFFEKDALLLKKHPINYLKLFLSENHWKNTDGFWENLLKGAQKYNVDISQYEIYNYYRDYMHAEDPVVKMFQGITYENKNYFPQSTLTVTSRTRTEAIKLLDKVKNNISDQPDDVKSYFETSIDRYTFTLQLVLGHTEKEIKKVLELGCSPGHLGMALDAMGLDVYGIDLNKEYLYKYPKSIIEKLHIKQCNFENDVIPYHDNEFDCVIFTEVLEHIAIKHPVKILEEIKRLLSPGGILILSTPNVSSIGNVFALMRGDNVFWDPKIFYGSTDRHNREYTPKEVFSLLQDAGFQNIKIGYINTPSNWNTKSAGLTMQFLAQIDNKQANEPFFKNTIFIKAEKR
ncbi:MAG: glycosyltransferase [Deltaproteobacteria bacterium]|nr:glycosyltransferase [Deltaproteobacteria bacterium]